MVKVNRNQPNFHRSQIFILFHLWSADADKNNSSDKMLFQISIRVFVFVFSLWNKVNGWQKTFRFLFWFNRNIRISKMVWYDESWREFQLHQECDLFYCRHFCVHFHCWWSNDWMPTKLNFARRSNPVKHTHICALLDHIRPVVSISLFPKQGWTIASFHRKGLIQIGMLNCLPQRMSDSDLHRSWTVQIIFFSQHFFRYTYAN